MQEWALEVGVEIYYYTTYSSGGCSAKDPGWLSYSETMPGNAARLLLAVHISLHLFGLKLNVTSVLLADISEVQSC